LLFGIAESKKGPNIIRSLFKFAFGMLLFWAEAPGSAASVIASPRKSEYFIS
jgi:hypothetical protein